MSVQSSFFVSDPNIQEMPHNRAAFHHPMHLSFTTKYELKTISEAGLNYCHLPLSLGAWMKWLREENDPLSPNPCLQILFVLEFIEYRFKTKLNKSINIGLDDRLKALKIVWHVKCTVFWFFFFIHCPPIMKCGSSSVSLSSSLSLLSPCLWSPLS